MKRNRKTLNCPVCDGSGKVKVIKNIAQIGKFHLGKEILEKCKYCEDKFIETMNELEGATIQ